MKKSKLSDAILRMWENDLHMERVQLDFFDGSGKKIDCYKYKDFYVRLDSFSGEDGYYEYCIEAADEEEAKHNVFDDAWIYDESDDIDAILTQMKRDLESEE